jgi:hypothetical protein
MEETPMRIELKTSDKALFHELSTEKIPGIKVGMRMGFMDCAESTTEISAVVTLAITIIGPVAKDLLSSWLKERFTKKMPEVATINNTNIVNNIENMTVIINNYEKDIDKKDE